MPLQTLAEFLGTDQATPEPTELPQLTVKDFCKGVLESREYRQSVLHRITLGTLPPAVECRMYDYAYGKPPDRVEHSGPDGKPIETITEVRRVVVSAALSYGERDEPSQVTY